MDANMERETLHYERMGAAANEQVTIEGEAMLPGSMRDAVTVLSVQARVHMTGVQAATDRIAIRGRVGFSVLYTQGDLTRIRVIETTCDFTHSLTAIGAEPGMRAEAVACVRETNGVAGSGRLSLSAQLQVDAKAFETAERSVVTGIRGEKTLCSREQTAELCACMPMGEEKALLREEFDLPDRLAVQDVLTATGTASITDITGTSGRVGVSGMVEVRVLHRPQKAGDALVMTTHEAPFEVTIPAQMDEGMQMSARAEVIDVMADSAAMDRQRTLRVEVEIDVRLYGQREEKHILLEDLYSTEGALLEPQTEEIDIYTAQENGGARESVRIQATLPSDAPPMETVLAAFANPVDVRFESAGRRMNAEGVMGLTLLYLPVDSDIPYAVRLREPFAMTFPIETGDNAQVTLEAIECGIGPATSDRVELRCVLYAQARTHSTKRLRIVTDVTEKPEEKRERGFVLVWPMPGETRWDTARRLRVPQESLRPAGAQALMAFIK